MSGDALDRSWRDRDSVTKGERNRLNSTYARASTRYLRTSLGFVAALLDCRIGCTGCCECAISEQLRKYLASILYQISAINTQSTPDLGSLDCCTTPSNSKLSPLYTTTATSSCLPCRSLRYHPMPTKKEQSTLKRQRVSQHLPSSHLAHLTRDFARHRKAPMAKKPIPRSLGDPIASPRSLP